MSFPARRRPRWLYTEVFRYITSKYCSASTLAAIKAGVQAEKAAKKARVRPNSGSRVLKDLLDSQGKVYPLNDFVPVDPGGGEHFDFEQRDSRKRRGGKEGQPSWMVRGTVAKAVNRVQSETSRARYGFSSRRDDYLQAKGGPLVEKKNPLELTRSDQGPNPPAFMADQRLLDPRKPAPWALKTRHRSPNPRIQFREVTQPMTIRHPLEAEKHLPERRPAEELHIQQKRAKEKHLITPCPA